MDGFGEGFGDTTAKQEKPAHLMDLPNAGEPFGDTTAKQTKPPDVYALETETIRGKPPLVLPDATSRDDAITIKDDHKKTMQSAVAVDLVAAPETSVPSTLDDDEPAAAQPRRPRVGPPTLASPGVPQPEWDGTPAYPNIAGYGGSPSPGPSLNAAPLGYAPPMGSPPPGAQAAASGSYAQAQPRAPLPPTYRISRRGPSGMQIALVLSGVGLCFVIFAIGILLFVSERIVAPPTASTRSTPPTEIAPGGSAAATPAATAFATTTSTTPPLQVESPQPATAAPPAPTPAPTPRATSPGGKSGKTPPGRAKNPIQDGR